MRIVTFGEVMLRLASAEHLRLRQSIPGRLDATFGGGELNVAVSIAFQGGHSAFLTVLPDNLITDALEQDLRKLNVDTDLIERISEGRFGVYFVESGANQRGGTVTYDRSGSAIALRQAEDYNWESVFQQAGWFHMTGITPAISERAARAALSAVNCAQSYGLTVSCDLNFRKKLWKWRPGTDPVELARETMGRMMPFVDIVVANEEDAAFSLGIVAAETNVESGKLNVDSYQTVARRIVAKYPNVRKVAITLRESISASHNNWGAMLYDAMENRSWFAPTDEEGGYQPYEIKNIVDRVGAGDSFAGALIVAWNTPELADPETALRYAVAASCLKHSIHGDFNYVTRSEIEALMNGSRTGRVQR